MSFKAELTADHNMEKKTISFILHGVERTITKSLALGLFYFCLVLFFSCNTGGISGAENSLKKVFFHIPMFVHTWPVMKRGVQIVPMMYCLSAQTSSTLLYSTRVYLVFLQIFYKNVFQNLNQREEQ